MYRSNVYWRFIRIFIFKTVRFWVNSETTSIISVVLSLCVSGCELCATEWSKMHIFRFKAKVRFFLEEYIRQADKQKSSNHQGFIVGFLGASFSWKKIVIFFFKYRSLKSGFYILIAKFCTKFRVFQQNIK